MFKFERHRNANALNYHRALLNTIRTVVVETQDLISHLWRQEANRTNSNKKYTHSQVETAVRTLAQNSPMNCTTYARVSIKLKKKSFPFNMPYSPSFFSITCRYTHLSKNK